MINYKNKDIKEVHYKGFDITQMYACGSNLVWEKEIPDGDFLTFVASSSGVFSCTANVKYSKNGSWWHTLAANGSIAVNSGDVIKWKGSVIPAPNGACRFGSSTAQFAVSGNPMSLILGDNFEGVTSLNGYDYAFEYMFNNCSGLTSIVGLSLPFTTISARCYRTMFAHCTSLASIPSILSAATVMKEKCYMNMFLGCTNLTSVPNDLLPSTTLAESCYYGMFAESGIIDAEGLELPATTLALSAYTMMFQRATSLEKAPILSASTLVDDCYHSMFYGCSSLSAITCLATDISAHDCVFDWVNGVAPSGEFTRESAMTDWQVDSINGIPIGWSIIPPLAFKLKASYSDGKSLNLACNGNGTITSGETRPSGYDYTKMKDAEIGDCTTSIGKWALRDCTSLISVTIPNSVTNIDDAAFYKCASLTSVTIPDSVTNIGGSAFADCTSLTSITINDTTPQTLGNRAFNNTNNCPIYVPCESVDAYKAAWSAYSSRIQCSPTSVISYSADNKLNVALSAFTPNAMAENFSNGVGEIGFNSNVTAIGNYAFSGKTSMTSVNIPNSVTSIGASAFTLCRSLSSITIPSGVTSIGASAFADCRSLSSITIPDSVTTLGDWAFASCSAATSLTIGSGVTSIGSYVFSRCYSLTSITIPNSVTSIGDVAFYGCTSLTNVTILDSVTSIGASAFASCRSLSSITIPSGVTSIGNEALQLSSGLTAITINATTPPTLGTNAFNYTNNCPIYVPCESVEAYKAAAGWRTYASRIQCIPPFNGKYKFTLRGGSIVSGECDSTSSITTADTSTYDITLRSVEIGDCVTNIGTEAFSTCLMLTSVTISDSVTSIGNYAFANCYGVSSFTIPSGVTSIGEWAFNMCGFDSITIKATTPPTLGYDVFDSSEDFKIYVPSASVNAYKSAWSAYADRIQAIS